MKAKKIINTVALTVLLLAGSAAAQTTASTTSTHKTGAATAAMTPGSPNTGSGGNAAENYAILAGSAALALGGIAALNRRRTT